MCSRYPKAVKIVNLHFPWIYIFARIYIPNLRKLRGKCKFYIFPKNVVFRRKIEDFCKNENFQVFLHTKNYYFFPYPWSAPWTFEIFWQSFCTLDHIACSEILSIHPCQATSTQVQINLHE